jgi:hypothetical protein
MAEQRWHTVSIYYYDANKDDLLLDCIRPLIITLHDRSWAERAYFIRHWQGGPHLRFQIYANPRVFEQEIAPVIIGEVSAYLQQHPSRGDYSEEDALREYEERSHIAHEQVAYVPLVPNNSIRIAPSDSRAAIIGSEGTARLLEDYYVATNELAFTIIEQTRNNYTARLNACLDQLVAVAATCPQLPLTRFVISYRSHSEAYIASAPHLGSYAENPDTRRRRLEEAYRERHDPLLRRIRLRLSQIETGQLPSWLAAIVAIHQRYFALALQGVAEGYVKLPNRSRSAEASYAGVNSSPREHLRQSAFHAALFDNRLIEEYLTTNPIMIAFRIVLNFLYLHLNRIGMRNEDRYTLDYYIVEALEELFNFSTLEAIRSFKLAGRV